MKDGIEKRMHEKFVGAKWIGPISRQGGGKVASKNFGGRENAVVRNGRENAFFFKKLFSV